MKKIIPILIALFFVQAANAQILNKIKQKAKQAANETISDVKNSARSGSSSSNSSTSGSNQSESEVDKAVDAVKPKAKSDIIFSSTRGGAAKTDFGINDNIYGRIMLDEPLYQALYDNDQDKEPFVWMSINLIYVKNNAARGEYLKIKIPKEDYNKKYIDFDILPAANDVKSEYDMAGTQWILMTPLANFGDIAAGGADFGTQEFWVNFGPNGEYKGNFKFTVANVREANAMKKRENEVRAGVSFAAAQTAQLPDVFSKPSAKNADPQLSFANIKKMLDAPDFRVLKMVIEANGTADYNIQKNELDIPLYKITARPVWVVYKDDKGQCKFTRYYFQRHYQGGGKYGPLEIATTTADHTPIACENVK